MALRADERRDKLRKASGRSKYPLIRRFLNGETYLSKPQGGYTSGGAPYGITWEEMGLKPWDDLEENKMV